MQLVLNFPVASHGVGQEFSIRRQAARVEASLHTDGDYTPQFLLKHMGKDLRLALASAGTAPLPQTQALMKPYQTAIERGLGDDNFADLRVNRQAQRLSPNSFCWRETPKIAYSGRVRLRILDKYLLREFAWPLIYSFDAFLLLFVVHDLLENLSEFLRQHARIGMILRYYLIVLPEPIVFILPLAVLLGVLFCLSMLGRHNELLAMRASGVSIWRLGLPFFVVGAIASAAAFGVSEKFVPQSRERAESLQRQMRGLPAVLKRQNFFFSNSQDRRDWYAREFDPEQNVMEDVAFYVRTSDGKPVMDMFARRAVWTEKRWRFEDARLVQPPAADVYVAATNFPFITETPLPRDDLDGTATVRTFAAIHGTRVATGALPRRNARPVRDAVDMSDRDRARRAARHAGEPARADDGSRAGAGQRGGVLHSDAVVVATRPWRSRAAGDGRLVTKRHLRHDRSDIIVARPLTPRRLTLKANSDRFRM